MEQVDRHVHVCFPSYDYGFLFEQQDLGFEDVASQMGNPVSFYTPEKKGPGQSSSYFGR